MTEGELNYLNNELYILVTSGWTCWRYVSVVGATKAGFIVHHRSHSEYMDRFSGTENCSSWWGVWDGRRHRGAISMKDCMTHFEEGRGAKSRIYRWCKNATKS